MAADAHLHMGVGAVGALLALLGDVGAGLDHVAAAHLDLLAVQVEHGHVVLGVVDGDGAVAVARAGDLAAQDRKQRGLRRVGEVDALMHAGEARAAVAVAAALAVLAVEHGDLAVVAAVEGDAHGVGDVQHDRRDGVGAGFVDGQVLLGHIAVKRGQDILAVVVGVHVVVVADGAATDVVVLADEPAVFLGDFQGAPGLPGDDDLGGLLLRCGGRFGGNIGRRLGFLRGGLCLRDGGWGIHGSNGVRARAWKRGIVLGQCADGKKQTRRCERRSHSFFHGSYLQK